MRPFFGIIAVIVLIFAALGIGAAVLFPSSWNTKKNAESRQTRIVIPQPPGPETGAWENQAERMARENQMNLKVPLEDGEILVTILNDDFDGDLQDEQIAAYRNLLELESPLYLTYIDYDENLRAYRRFWSAPAAATRPGTVSLYTQDLIGDRSLCVLLSGMNGLGEHTLTIFRKPPQTQPPSEGEENQLFTKIGELRIDGSISVRETERSQAYQLGMARGASFSILAYGRDYDSSNIMDQVEITYTYNVINGLYEQSRVTPVPGTQIEQRRLQELLGNPGAFEEFITGLWYYVSAQGTIDSRQYIYFDPPNREIIFYGDETQQVFTWQNSSATRYGLYVSSQNISVTTLRRSIDLELESLDSIKVRVVEDVRLKLGVNTVWDGSYRKAEPMENRAAKPSGNSAYIDAVYDGSIGKIRFYPDGNYEFYAGDAFRQGKYAFFSLEGRELLELRSTDPRVGGLSRDRETYVVESPSVPEGEEDKAGPRKTMTLLRVRLGARGIQELHEGTISLTLANE
ncbi:MAG: pallilysin-related adhesin [Treponema sp.]|nr:pallilysin-related adhesin [Treponema sp.]